MNNTFLRCSWGFVYGFIASLIFSAFITIIGNGLAGGGTLDGWGWFFIGLSVPLSITVSIAGYYHAFKNLSRLKILALLRGIRLSNCYLYEHRWSING
ncbi:hypothetical protein [Paenibacillus mucilaginosus]|uniref:hypothetical protein n=1 Tax=Paenibacillus mucilaginosus TaxID=61624 RepID=UPI0011D29F3C|nr:hypothetical protein [Paenibacillus mucilaginosus]